MSEFIEVQHAEMVFSTGRGRFHALADVNLTIAKGEFVTLIGHSGCGKSTLLNLLAACCCRPKALCSATTARSPSPGLSALWCSRTTRCCLG